VTVKKLVARYVNRIGFTRIGSDSADSMLPAETTEPGRCEFSRNHIFRVVVLFRGLKRGAQAGAWDLLRPYGKSTGREKLGCPHPAAHPL
jgi:hypothetical protein